MWISFCLPACCGSASLHQFSVRWILLSASLCCAQVRSVRGSYRRHYHQVVGFSSWVLPVSIPWIGSACCPAWFSAGFCRGFHWVAATTTCLLHTTTYHHMVWLDSWFMCCLCFCLPDSRFHHIVAGWQILASGWVEFLPPPPPGFISLTGWVLGAPTYLVNRSAGFTWFGSTYSPFLWFYEQLVLMPLPRSDTNARRGFLPHHCLPACCTAYTCTYTTAPPACLLPPLVRGNSSVTPGA